MPLQRQEEVQRGLAELYTGVSYRQWRIKNTRSFAESCQCRPFQTQELQSRYVCLQTFDRMLVLKPDSSQRSFVVCPVNIENLQSARY